MKKLFALLLSVLALGLVGLAGATNMLNNPSLDAYGNSPNPVYWSGINPQYHGSATDAYVSSPNSWKFWGKGMIYQDITSGFTVGHVLHFSGYFFMRGNTALSGGGRQGVIQAEFYNSSGDLLAYSRADPLIMSSSTVETGFKSENSYVIPATTTTIRFCVFMNRSNFGYGSFYADDVVAEDVTVTPTCTNTPVVTATPTRTTTPTSTVTPTKSPTPNVTGTPVNTATPTTTPTPIGFYLR